MNNNIFDMDQFMNTVYPIAQMGDEFLIVHKSDVKKIPSIDIKSLTVEISSHRIGELTELEKHLKFNRWEEILEESKRVEVLESIVKSFSEKEIEENIVLVLENNKTTSVSNEL